MFKDVELYVQQCDRCQRIGKRKLNERLYPIKTGQQFELVRIDIIGPLTPSLNSHHYIIITIDYLMKWAEAHLIHFTDSTEVTAFIYEDIISHHGIPKTLISDNGSHFINIYITSICDKFGIQHNRTSAYNPQANGLVERLNQTIANSLKRLDPNAKPYWDNFIPAMLYAYRTLRQSTTKYTPFYLTYGRNHNPLPFENNNDMNISDDYDWTEQMEEKLQERINDQIQTLTKAREEAGKLIKKTQLKQQLYLDRKLNEAPK